APDRPPRGPTTHGRGSPAPPPRGREPLRAPTHRRCCRRLAARRPARVATDRGLRRRSRRARRGGLGRAIAGYRDAVALQMIVLIVSVSIRYSGRMENGGGERRIIPLA